MDKIPYRDESERRIGEFLIKHNILTSAQVLSVVLNSPDPDDSWEQLEISDIAVSQMNDLSN